MKTILGDCLEVMKTLESGSIDMVLADPPYGTTACKWDSVIPFERMWSEVRRVAKPKAAVCIFGSEPFASTLRASNLSEYRYDWYWYKNNPTGIALSKTQPMRAIESISVFADGSPSFFKQMMPSKIKDRPLGRRNGKFGATAKQGTNTHGFAEFVKKDNPDNILKEMVNPRNVLEFAVVPRATGTLHPTQKPVALLEYLIKTYTKHGDTVLDFCMGSGSTGVACVNTGRDFIGIERDEKYFEIANKRIDMASIVEGA